MGGYSINPVLDGLLQGVKIAHAIKSQQLEQQALQLQKQRQDRQAQIEDLQTRMGLLQSGAETTQKGPAGPTAQRSMHNPGANVNGIEVGGSDETTNAPVDPGRVLNYGGRGYYIPTPNEQFQTQLPMLQAQAAMKNSAELGLYGGKKNIDLQHDVSLEDLRAQNARNLKTQEETFQAGQNDKTRTNQRDVAGINQGGANARNAATNSTSVKTAAMRIAETKREYDLDNAGGANGATPGQSMLQGRANQRFLKEADDVAQKKAAVDEKLDDVNSALSQEDGSSYRDARGNELEMNGELRAQLGRKKTMLQTASDAHAKRLKEISGYVHQGEAQPPVPGTAAANPYRK